jgi:hypothetical protein
MANQKLMTPLDYVAFLAGAPPPPKEPEVQYQPVPTPVYMPNPQTLDMSQMPGMGGPQLPPPIAPPAPPGFQGGMGGMMAPAGGAFG